jgi:hypothetical protein
MVTAHDLAEQHELGRRHLRDTISQNPFVVGRSSVTLHHHACDKVFKVGMAPKYLDPVDIDLDIAEIPGTCSRKMSLSPSVLPLMFWDMENLQNGQVSF